MLQSHKIKNELYQNLGKLFYAVAMADKHIHSVEIKKLKESIKEHWLTVDDVADEFGTDAAYQIEIVFDWLQGEEKEATFYYEEFKDFFKEYKAKFTPRIRLLIWNTADAIAASFAGLNKSELILLAKLRILLQ